MEQNNLGPGKLSALGLQHVAVMYGGAVAVPLIIGPAIGLTQEQLIYLIAYDILACGIATLIQVIGNKHIGIRLPVLMAVSFVVVQPAIAIGEVHSLTGIFGAVIVAGILVTILAQFADKIIPYFPPLVTGAVILIIGVSLMPVAMDNAAGGVDATGSDYGSLENLALAGFTLLLFLCLNHFFTGFMKAVALLFSMIIGSFIAVFFGMVDFTILREADWILIPQPPSL